MTRRNFVTAMAALPLCAAGGSVHLGCQTNAWPIDPQNFSSFLAVLDKIKGYGFEGFETSYLNVQAQFPQATHARELIAKTGLRFFGVHIFLLQYDPETSIPPERLMRQVVDGASQLGAGRLIVSGASTTGRAALASKTAAMDRAARYAQEKGMRFAYHNHDAEFRSGGAEIEALYAAAGSGPIRFILDAGHAYEAKADVPAFFARHQAVIDGIHLRDFRNGRQVPLGEGTVDLKAMVAGIRREKWSGWVLAEEERLAGVKPGDTAVAPARKTLGRLFGN
jgi:inosose dehydratase